MYAKKSNVARISDIAPVRLENGRWLFRCCQPKLRTEQPTTRNRTEFNRKTVGDVLCQLKQNREIYKIVRGDK